MFGDANALPLARRRENGPKQRGSSERRRGAPAAVSPEAATRLFEVDAPQVVLRFAAPQTERRSCFTGGSIVFVTFEVDATHGPPRTARILEAIRPQLAASMRVY